MYTQLRLVEIFHIEFLRYLTADMPPGLWALKGGVNLRLFFKSILDSEAMDLNVNGFRFPQTAVFPFPGITLPGRFQL